jgi:hypothetical protein
MQALGLDTHVQGHGYVFRVGSDLQSKSPSPTASLLEGSVSEELILGASQRSCIFLNALSTKLLRPRAADFHRRTNLILNTGGGARYINAGLEAVGPTQLIPVMQSRIVRFDCCRNLRFPHLGSERFVVSACD